MFSVPLVPFERANRAAAKKRNEFRSTYDSQATGPVLGKGQNWLMVAHQLASAYKISWWESLFHESVPVAGPGEGGCVACHHRTIPVIEEEESIGPLPRGSAMEKPLPFLTCNPACTIERTGYLSCEQQPYLFHPTTLF